MKVKDLIIQLNLINPEMDVVIFDGEFGGDLFKFISVESLEVIETETGRELAVLNSDFEEYETDIDNTHLN
jgi:hypothetical protein